MRVGCRVTARLSYRDYMIRYSEREVILHPARGSLCSVMQVLTRVKTLVFRGERETFTELRRFATLRPRGWSRLFDGASSAGADMQ